MGCDAAKEQNLPTLLCFFETNNDEQKEFCIKLKDSFQHEKSIKYEIRSSVEPFSVKLKIKNFIYDIKTEYNTSIKSYLKEHPEASKGFAELKVKYLQEYGKTPDLPKAALKRAGVSYPQQNTESNQSQKPESETKETGDKYETNRVVDENSSAKEITESIKSGDITVLDAIKICKETAYKAIFNDPDLFHKNSVIAKLYINENRKDLKTESL